MADLMTKAAFANLVRVTPSCVSHWIKDGKIFGDAIFGEGHRAKIRVVTAIEQLKTSLDVTQRTSANARARLDLPVGRNGVEDARPAAAVPDTIEAEIKRQRLEQLELANEREREAKALRAGIYVKAEESRRELGAACAKLMTLFDSSLYEFATAIAAAPGGNLTIRNALHILRDTFRGIRTRNSKNIAQGAAALPALVADEPADPAVAEIHDAENLSTEVLT